MSEDTGRRDASEELTHDAPNATVEGMLTKQDELIDAIKALCVKLDADVGVTDADYASSISDALAKLKLRL